MAEEVPNYTVRHMKPEEIPAVLDLWKETNLSEGTYSLHTFYEYDPEGFFVAVTDDGTVIGSCAGVKQNEDVYFMGMYAVRSTYRGRGIGLKIWDAVMSRVGEKNIGVNPVPEQLTNYRDRSGLPTQTDWVTYQCEAPDLDPSLFSPPEEVQLKTLDPEDADTLQRIAAYDAQVFGFDRGELVRLACSQPESATVVAERSSGDVCGYGNVKANVKSLALVGPLYADDAGVAEAVLRELVTEFPFARQGVTVMITDKNREAVRMAERLGFRFGEAIGRLYRKDEVHVEYQKVFSQHNLNFSLF